MLLLLTVSSAQGSHLSGMERNLISVAAELLQECHFLALDLGHEDIDDLLVDGLILLSSKVHALLNSFTGIHCHISVL